MSLQSIKVGSVSKFACTAEKSGSMFGLDDSVGSFSLEVTILPWRDLNGQKVLVYKQDMDGKVSFTFMAEDSEGIYTYAEQGPTDAEPILVPGKRYDIKYPIKVGNSWNYSNDKGENITSSIVAEEEVTVPAGNFKCLKIETVGKYNMDGQLANIKGLEWIVLNGDSIKSYIEWNDGTITYKITSQLSSKEN